MDDTVFATRDIYLASTLITLKFKMIGVSYQIEGEKAMPVGYFEFEKTPTLLQATRSYWQGDIAVEPRQFIGNMRGLKAEITGTYKNPYTRKEDFKKAAPRQ